MLGGPLEIKAGGLPGLRPAWATQTDCFRETDKGMNREDPKIIQNQITKGKNAKEMKEEGKGRKRGN